MQVFSYWKLIVSVPENLQETFGEKPKFVIINFRIEKGENYIYFSKECLNGSVENQSCLAYLTNSL